MDIIFTSDLHGHAALYEQLLELLKRQRCDVLIFGGDMLPKGDTKTPYREVCHYIQNDFSKLLHRIHDAVDGLNVLTVFGNNDWLFSVDQFAGFEEKSLLTMLRPDRPIRIGEFTFLGLSHCNPTPFHRKDFERRDLAADRPADFDGFIWSIKQQQSLPVRGREYYNSHSSLEEMLNGHEKADVFVSHVPPVTTKLDTTYSGQHAGSKAVRNYIGPRQPIVSFHGHIHESPNLSGSIHDCIGKTLCINPGQPGQHLSAAFWSSEQPDQVQSVG